ncbi:MAG: hypothetical protein ACO1N9_11750 [Flavobacterium sp.]
MSNILFIASGDSKTGFGHIARSLMLCNEFSLKGYTVSIAVKKDCPFINTIEREGTAVQPVSSFSENDVAINEADTIIIDTVEADYNTLRWLGSAVNNNQLLVSITLFLFNVEDRYEHLSFFPDFQPDRQETHNTPTGNVIINIGKSYLTLRPEFSSITPVPEGEKSDVLITMGGSDPEGFTLQSLEAIADEDISVTVIISEVAGTFAKVKEIVDRNPRIQIITHTSSIANMMAAHKIVMINGGLTRYEACAAGTPFIAISMHDLQYGITEKVTSHGVGVNLGVGSRLSGSDIKNAVSILLNDRNKREQMQQNMQGLISLSGSEAIVNTIINFKKHAGTY